MKNWFFIILPLLVASCSEQTKTTNVEEIKVNQSVIGYQKVNWIYDSEFTQTQKDTIEKWMTDAVEYTYETIGQYPFEMSLFFHKAQESNDPCPVPFGRTSRKTPLEIHFYVKPNASYAKFMEDWTAPHEISHLSVPSFGKENKWLSEGYATYLSRRIMIKMGYYTEQEFDEIYLRKIGDAKVYYNDSMNSFAQVSRNLFAKYRFGTVYWGGAGFYYQLDEVLQAKHDMRFEDLIKKYQEHGRLSDENLEDVIASWDRILGDNVCDSMLKAYENKPAFEVMKRF